MKTTAFRYCMLFAALFFVACSAPAQQEPNLEQGLRPHGSYQGGNIDAVNLSNGNVTVKTDLWRVPQRGGKLDLDYFWMYNNKSFFVNETCDVNGVCTDFWDSRGVGVAIGNSLNVAYSSEYQVVGIGGNGEPSLWDAFATVSTPDGGTHKIANFVHSTGCSAPCPTVAGGRAADGSGWLLTSQGQLFDGTGVLHPNAFNASTPTQDLNYPQWWLTAALQAGAAEDPNGNLITYIDTMGRTIPVPSATADYSGCTGPYPITYAILYPFPGLGGSNAAIPA